MSRDRVAYSIAGNAMREVIVRASAEKLTQSDWRTLAGVLYLLPSYSRLEDNVYIAQVAKAGNVSDHQARRSRRSWTSSASSTTGAGVEGRHHASLSSQIWTAKCLATQSNYWTAIQRATQNMRESRWTASMLPS